LLYVGILLQLLFVRDPNMFKGIPQVYWKAHQIVKYLKLKQMNPSIKLMELMLYRVNFGNEAFLKET